MNIFDLINQKNRRDIAASQQAFNSVKNFVTPIQKNVSNFVDQKIARPIVNEIRQVPRQLLNFAKSPSPKWIQPAENKVKNYIQNPERITKSVWNNVTPFGTVDKVMNDTRTPVGKYFQPTPQLRIRDVMREIPHGAYETAKMFPQAAERFVASALEAPNSIRKGQASGRFYNTPFGRVNSFQSEAQNRVQRGDPLWKAIGNPAIDTLLAGLDVSQFAKPIFNSAKSIKFLPEEVRNIASDLTTPLGKTMPKTIPSRVENLNPNGIFQEGTGNFAQGGIPQVRNLENPVRQTGGFRIPEQQVQVPFEFKSKLLNRAGLTVKDEGLGKAGYKNPLIQEGGIYPNKQENINTGIQNAKEKSNTPTRFPIQGENPVIEKPKVSIPQDTKNKVELKITGNTEKEKIQSAIVNSERVKNELNIRGKDAFVDARKLSPNDLKLAEQYETGQSIDDLAKQAENPKQFKKAMNKVADYYDFRLATDRALGGETPLRQNYIPHNWDLSNPQDLARFNEIARQRGIQPYNGFKSQPRVFKTYAEGEALGFKRQNPNILGDLQNDYGASSTVLSRQALKQGLGESAPGKVSMNGMGQTPEGKPFVNSNIPGLEGMSFHPDVNKNLKGFQPKTNQDVFQLVKEKGLVGGLKEGGFLNTVGTLYDRATQPMKHFLLNFSGFHSINVSANYSGSSLFEANMKGTKGIAESIPSFLSETFTKKIEDGFRSKLIPGTDMSIFDAGLRSGVNMDRGIPAAGLRRLNPFTAQSRAIFDRELHTLKLNLVDQVFSSGKVNPESPQGRELGREINQIMGEMNNHTMNINPNSQKWMTRLLLAPQFTESKYVTIGKALTKNPTKTLALKAVVGKSIVMGTLASLGTLLATGKFPNLQQLLLNYTIAPDTQTNLESPSGKKQDVSWPQTFVSEPSRPIAGLMQGSTDALTHYAQSRLNPVLSDMVSAYTNKDYYGNPIVDPNSDKSTLSQLASNVGVGDLPIGVQQIQSLMSGKQTIPQTAINVAGLRTHVSPNDPTNAMWQDYADQKQIAQIQQDMRYGKISEANGMKQIENLKNQQTDAASKSNLQSGDVQKVSSPSGDYYKYKTSQGIAFADTQQQADKAVAKDKLKADLQSGQGINAVDKYKPGTLTTSMINDLYDNGDLDESTKYQLDRRINKETSVKKATFVKTLLDKKDPETLKQMYSDGTLSPTSIDDMFENGLIPPKQAYALQMYLYKKDVAVGKTQRKGYKAMSTFDKKLKFKYGQPQKQPQQNQQPQQSKYTTQFRNPFFQTK
jgi:hypothetical protein